MSNPIDVYQNLFSSASDPFQAWVDHVDNMPATAKVEAFRNMLTAIAESNELGNNVVFKLLQWGSDRPSIL